MQIVGTQHNVRLGDILDIRDGTHDTPRYVESGIPLITSKNLTDNGLSFESASFISEADHLEISKRSGVNRGDILYGMIGTIGKPTLVNTDRVFSIKNVALFKHSGDRIDARYLLWLLQSQEINRQIESSTRGGTQKFVSLGVLRGLRATIPPLPEQRRIAAILDKADALRSKRRETLAQLDRLAQSIFVEMFGDLFANTKGFPVSRLGDCCDVRDGTHDSPSYVAEGYPLVTSKNLRDGKVDLSDVNFISEADYNEINRRSKVDTGDILMPMIGTIGNPVLVEEEPSFAIKNMALIKFKPNSPCREFVLQFLRSDCFDRLVASKNKGGTQKFLALGEIRGLPLPVPPEAGQVEFSQRIQAINRKRTRYEAALAGTDGLFASLQHRAFRGEI